MVRVFYAAIALMGLGAAIANRRFAAASHETSAKYFGRPIRPGSAESRFMTVFSRALTVVVGLAMFVMGILGALGIVWRE